MLQRRWTEVIRRRNKMSLVMCSHPNDMWPLLVTPESSFTCQCWPAANQKVVANESYASHMASHCQPGHNLGTAGWNSS
jgi:hypothetical protein